MKTKTSKYSSFEEGLDAIRRRWKHGDFVQALKEADRLLKRWPDNPRLLVMRASLIQLQESNQAPPLENAKKDLQRAVQLDDQSPFNLIELGHFQLAVEDDCQAARKTFDKAVRLCRSSLKEALLGQAEALSELNRRSEALALLAEAFFIHSRNGESSADSNGKEILERLDALKSSD